MTLVDATAGTGHRFGVCSLASTSAAAWGGGSQLLSAGRDGTICAWKYSADAAAAVAPELSFVLEDHTDWVNDLVLVHEGGQAAALVSCSSDTTLKVWRPSGQAGQPAECHTMRRHTDYVKALAYAPQARLLASASCDRTVLLWDLHTLQPCGGSSAAGDVNSHRDSVYCLATNPTASLLASGSVDNDVRLWDPRSAEGHFTLRGHTDAVRGLAMSEDGTRLISCGSDRTVRIWHLGERRCEQVFTPHEDSVFCLAVDPAWTSVLSGGRDGTVCMTPLRGGAAPHSTLLCKGRGIVQRLLSPPEHPELLWVASSESMLNCWALPPAAQVTAAAARPVTPRRRTAPAPPSSPGATPPAATPPCTPSAVAVGMCSPGSGPGSGGSGVGGGGGKGPEAVPLLSSPQLTISGAAGVHQYAVMPSKLQVLTEDTAGNAAVWDIWRGEIASRHTKKARALKGP